jgi:hypothetical protein
MHVESIRQRMKGSQAVKGKVVYAGNKIYTHMRAGKSKLLIGWARTAYIRKISLLDMQLR